MEVSILGLPDPKTGASVDISMGGIKVDLAEELGEDLDGEPCAVRFLNAGEELLPHYVVGTVRRVESYKQGSLLAVEFARPLDLLDLGARALP